MLIEERDLDNFCIRDLAMIIIYQETRTFYVRVLIEF